MHKTGLFAFALLLGGCASGGADGPQAAARGFQGLFLHDGRNHL